MVERKYELQKAELIRDKLRKNPSLEDIKEAERVLELIRSGLSQPEVQELENRIQNAKQSAGTG